jgi:hypothetical protein
LAREVASGTAAASHGGDQDYRGDR